MIAILFSFLLSLTNQETLLINKINDYRQQHGLIRLKTNDSLNIVAYEHAKNIDEHYIEGISLHSWSKNNKWLGGVFDINDPNTYSIIWDKPRELLGMDKDGFEIAHRHSNSNCTSECAYNNIISSVPHNNMLLEQGYDKFTQIGVSIYKGIACIWLA